MSQETVPSVVHDNAPQGTPIVSVRDVVLRLAHLTTAEQEHFYVLGLDAKHRVTVTHLAALGTVDRGEVHPRDVFRELIRGNCVSMIICHNHPSGDPSPSAEDDALTQRLNQAAQLLGIDLLDHVIIGRETVYSYEERKRISR